MLMVVKSGQLRLLAGCPNCRRMRHHRFLDPLEIMRNCPSIRVLQTVRETREAIP